MLNAVTESSWYRPLKSSQEHWWTTLLTIQMATLLTWMDGHGLHHILLHDANVSLLPSDVLFTLSAPKGFSIWLDKNMLQLMFNHALLLSLPLQFLRNSFSWCWICAKYVKVFVSKHFFLIYYYQISTTTAWYSEQNNTVTNQLKLLTRSQELLKSQQKKYLFSQ